MSTKCDECGETIRTGDWPFCPHGPALPSKGFEPFVDWNLGPNPVTITNPGDYRKHFKPRWENDNIVHIQPRDKSDSYYRELNQRRAHRAEMERKNR